MEFASDVLAPWKAPRVPTLVALAMETYVIKDEAPVVLRVVAWARLIKLYGGPR